MRRLFWLMVWSIIAAAIAAGASVFFNLPFWWIFFIVIAAIFINGWFATLEDDLPGGFNNPDGTNTPRYAVVTGWIVRGLGAILAFLIIFVLLVAFFGKN